MGSSVYTCTAVLFNSSAHLAAACPVDLHFVSKIGWTEQALLLRYSEDTIIATLVKYTPVARYHMRYSADIDTTQITPEVFHEKLFVHGDWRSLKSNAQLCKGIVTTQ